METLHDPAAAEIVCRVRPASDRFSRVWDAMNATAQGRVRHARLLEEEIRAVAVIRLMATGWRAESLTDEAVVALASYAADDRHRLDYLLTTASFLARMDQAVRIGPEHVAGAAGDKAAIAQRPANVSLPRFPEPVPPPSAGAAQRGLGVAAALVAVALTLWMAAPGLPAELDALAGAAPRRPAPLRQASPAPPTQASAQDPSLGSTSSARPDAASEPTALAQASPPDLPSRSVDFPPTSPRPSPAVATPSTSPAPADARLSKAAVVSPPRPAMVARGPSIVVSGAAAGAGLVLVAGPGDTLPKLYHQVYRGLPPPPYAAVAFANPGSITPGTMLVFPAPVGGWHGR